MRFDELIHWNDGLFMQPHHLQYLQRTMMQYGQKNRSFAFSYPDGLIDFDFDREAFSSGRIVVKRFSAIMPDGTCISQPGNVTLSSLDVNDVIQAHEGEFKVYLAVPVWSEFEPNQADFGDAQKRLYKTIEKSVRDENTGDNEIAVVTRQVNARLVTEFDDLTDLSVLPILKFSIVTDDKASKTISFVEKYIPPYFVMKPECPIVQMVTNLLMDMRRCCDKMLNDLMVAQFKTDSFSGTTAYNILQYKTINLYENRLAVLLNVPNVSPFDLYLELRSFLAELIGLHPMNEIKNIEAYNHYDCSGQFIQLINDIQSMIASEGSASYICLKFKPIDNGDYLFTDLKMADILKAKEYYLAIHSDIESRRIINALETGDTFKLINPRSKNIRARGIKLIEMRYPPRYLPNMNDTLWFKLETEETPRTWQDICTEQGVLIDYARDLFPGLEVSLFLTVVDEK